MPPGHGGSNDRRSPSLAARQAAAAAAGVAPEAWRDWGGRLGNELPVDVLAVIAKKFVALNDATYAALLQYQDDNDPFQDEDDYVDEREQHKQKQLAARKRESASRGLFIFAMVCKGWRAAQLRVGGPLRTLIMSDVFLATWTPGTDPYRRDPPRKIIEWALAQGCPKKKTEAPPRPAKKKAKVSPEALAKCKNKGQLMATLKKKAKVSPEALAKCKNKGQLMATLKQRAQAGGAAAAGRYPRYPHLACIAMEFGELEMVRWLCMEQGFPVDDDLKNSIDAARHGPAGLFDMRAVEIVEYIGGTVYHFSIGF